MVNLSVNDLIYLHIRRLSVNYEKCRVIAYFYHDKLHKMVLSTAITFVCWERGKDEWSTSFAPTCGVDIYANEGLLSRIHREAVKDFGWLFED